MLGSLCSIFYTSSFAYEGSYYSYKTINIVNFVNSCTMQMSKNKELDTYEIFEICSCVCDKIRINWTEQQYLEMFVGSWQERNKEAHLALTWYARDCTEPYIKKNDENSR